MVGRDNPLSFVVKSGDYEVGILGGNIVARRAGLFTRLLRELGVTELAALLTHEEHLAIALASVHNTGGVLRIYRLGQPWLLLDAVAAADHYLAMDFVDEVRRQSGAY